MNRFASVCHTTRWVLAIGLLAGGIACSNNTTSAADSQCVDSADPACIAATGKLIFTSTSATPAVLYPGDSVEFRVQGAAENGALGPDSIVVYSTSIRVFGSLGGALDQKMAVATTGTFSAAVYMYGRDSKGSQLTPAYRAITYRVSPKPTASVTDGHSDGVDYFRDRANTN